MSDSEGQRWGSLQWRSEQAEGGLPRSGATCRLSGVGADWAEVRGQNPPGEKMQAHFQPESGGLVRSENLGQPYV